MPTTKTQAAKLLSAAEMDVFNGSSAAAVKELSAARLNGKVKRARTLRDKFRDLLQRQKVATRGRTGTKVGVSGSANERTAQKAEIFDEVLQRYSARLEQVEAKAAREVARDAAAKAKSQARAEKAGAAKTARSSKPATPAKSAKTAKTAKTGSKTAAGAQSTIRGAVKAAVGKKAQASRPAGKAPSRSAKAPAVDPGNAGGSGVGLGSKGARAAAKQSKLAAGRERPIQGHISSAVRRNQAKRDAKG